MFRCSNCSHSQPKWTGKCPACGEWNVLGEVPDEPKKTSGTANSTNSGKTLPVTSISNEKSEANRRIPVASSELSNLL